MVITSVFHMRYLHNVMSDVSRDSNFTEFISVMIFKVFTFILVTQHKLNAESKFCKGNEMISHEFHPLRHCQRSNKTVIAFSNVTSIKACAAFASERRGLAFNFSPQNRMSKNGFELNETEENEEFFNCEVLECPEYKNYSSIVNDTRFDYFSLYTRPPREMFKSLKRRRFRLKFF